MIAELFFSRCGEFTLNKPVQVANQKWNDDVVPLVSVACFAYNHGKYIRNAIEGFIMQKTTFPIEIIIHDDASRDNTAEIVMDYEIRYPKIIKPIYQRINQHSLEIGRVTRLVYTSAAGKYLAICEGDDYWTDPYKLQKQVDFLENNPDYGLVHTELDHYYVKKGKYVKNHWLSTGVTNQSGDLYNSLLGGGESMIYTCTVCLRRELILGMKYENLPKYMIGDIPLWLHIAAKSKIGYINESTAVRNVLPFSATQGRDFNYKLKFIQSSLLIFTDYNNIRPFSKEAAYNFKQRYCRNICNLCYQFRERYDLFDENYKNLDDDYRTLNLRLKKFLFKYKIPNFISRVFLKIIKILFPFKNN